MSATKGSDFDARSRRERHFARRAWQSSHHTNSRSSPLIHMQHILYAPYVRAGSTTRMQPRRNRRKTVGWDIAELAIAFLVFIVCVTFRLAAMGGDQRAKEQYNFACGLYNMACSLQQIERELGHIRAKLNH